MYLQAIRKSCVIQHLKLSKIEIKSTKVEALVTITRLPRHESATKNAQIHLKSSLSWSKKTTFLVFSFDFTSRYCKYMANYYLNDIYYSCVLTGYDPNMATTTLQCAAKSKE